MSLRNLLSGSVGSDSVAEGAARSSLHSRFFGTLLDAERELWFLAIAAMLVDITLTVHGLQLGLEEMNPVAQRALDTAGALGLYGLKGMAILVGVCCRPLIPDRVNAIIPLALAIPSLVAVGINSTLIAIVLF